MIACLRMETAATDLVVSAKEIGPLRGHKIVQNLVTSCNYQQDHEHHPICRHNHGTPCCALLQGKLVCTRTTLYLNAKLPWLSMQN